MLFVESAKVMEEKSAETGVEWEPYLPNRVGLEQ